MGGQIGVCVECLTGDDCINRARYALPQDVASPMRQQQIAQRTMSAVRQDVVSQAPVSNETSSRSAWTGCPGAVVLSSSLCSFIDAVHRALWTTSRQPESGSMCCKTNCRTLNRCLPISLMERPHPSRARLLMWRPFGLGLKMYTRWSGFSPAAARHEFPA